MGLYIIEAIIKPGTRLTLMLTQKKVGAAVQDCLNSGYKVVSVVRLESYL